MFMIRDKGHLEHVSGQADLRLVKDRTISVCAGMHRIVVLRGLGHTMAIHRSSGTPALQDASIVFIASSSKRMVRGVESRSALESPSQYCQGDAELTQPKA